MRNILRDPGAEVVVGLLSFSASFVAIGLAITPFTDKTPLLSSYAFAAFVIAALLFVIAVIAIIILLRDLTKTKGHIRQVGQFLREGRELRGELLSVRTVSEWTEERQGKVPQWKANVQRWLEENLPEHAPEFDVEGFLVNLDTGEGVNGHASNAAQHLEGRMSNLREILREIRR